MNTNYQEVSRYYSQRIKDIFELLFFSAIEKYIRTSEVHDYTGKYPITEGKIYPLIAEFLDIPSTYTSVDNAHRILSKARKGWDIIHYNPLAAIIETLYLSAPANIPGFMQYNDVFRNTLEYDLLVPCYGGNDNVTAIYIKDGRLVGFNAVTFFEILKEYRNSIEILRDSDHYLVLLHHGDNNPLPKDIRNPDNADHELLKKVRNRIFVNFADINSMIYAEDTDLDRIKLPSSYLSAIYDYAFYTVDRMANFVHRDSLHAIVTGHTNLLLLLCYLEVQHRRDNRDPQILKLYNRVLKLYDFETDRIGIPELTLRPYPFSDKEIPQSDYKPVSDQDMIGDLILRISYFVENIEIEKYQDKLEKHMKEDMEIQKTGLLFRESYMEDLRKGNKPKSGDKVPFNQIDHKRASDLSWIASRSYLDCYMKNLSEIYGI